MFVSTFLHRVLALYMRVYETEHFRITVEHFGLPPREHFRITVEHRRFVVIWRFLMFVDVVVVVIRYFSSTTRTRASAWAGSFFPRHVFLRSVAVTRLSANYRARCSDTNWRWEKHKKGGLNCVLKNFFVPYVEELFSGSESEVIQSLREFRVVCSG